MNVSTFPPPSFAAQFAELKRERAMRARVYPHWVASGKIKKQTADYQLAALEAAMATLEALALGKTAADPLRDELAAGLRALLLVCTVEKFTAAEWAEVLSASRILAKVPV